MHNGDSAFAVGVGMGVGDGGPPMGGPSGVAQAKSAVGGIAVKRVHQVAYFAYGLVELKRTGREQGYDASAIVTTIFQAFQAF
jgi:hypothetical protein